MKSLLSKLLIPAAAGALFFGSSIDTTSFNKISEQLSPRQVYLFLMEIYAAQVEATKVDWSGPVIFDNEFSYRKHGNSQITKGTPHGK